MYRILHASIAIAFIINEEESVKIFFPIGNKFTPKPICQHINFTLQSILYSSHYADEVSTSRIWKIKRSGKLQKKESFT